MRLICPNPSWQVTVLPSPQTVPKPSIARTEEIARWSEVIFTYQPQQSETARAPTPLVGVLFCDRRLKRLRWLSREQREPYTIGS